MDGGAAARSPSSTGGSSASTSRSPSCSRTSALTPKSRKFLEQVKNLRIDKSFEVAALRAMVAERLRESS
jgi:hypothetical protein